MKLIRFMFALHYGTCVYLLSRHKILWYSSMICMEDSRSTNGSFQPLAPDCQRSKPNGNSNLAVNGCGSRMDKVGKSGILSQIKVLVLEVEPLVMSQPVWKPRIRVVSYRSYKIERHSRASGGKARDTAGRAGAG